MDEARCVCVTAVIYDTSDCQREDVQGLELPAYNFIDELRDNHGEVHLADLGRYALDTLDGIGLDLHGLVLQVCDESGADALLQRLFELLGTLRNLVAEVKSPGVSDILIEIGTVLQHLCEGCLSLAVYSVSHCARSYLVFG